MSENISVSYDFIRMAVMGAVRYYLGRHTIAVHGFCKRLVDMLPQLDGGTKAILERDVSEWLAGHPTHVFAGVDDAEPWKRVLEALRKEEPCGGSTSCS